MPSQGAYDEFVKRDVSPGDAFLEISYIIGQIRPGRCDVYTRLPAAAWHHENLTMDPPSRDVVSLSVDGAGLRGGEIGVGFKIALLKDGGQYHAECHLACNGDLVQNGSVVFDGKGSKSIVWLWATFKVT